MRRWPCMFGQGAAVKGAAGRVPRGGCRREGAAGRVRRGGCRCEGYRGEGSAVLGAVGRLPLCRVRRGGCRGAGQYGCSACGLGVRARRCQARTVASCLPHTNQLTFSLLSSRSAH